MRDNCHIYAITQPSRHLCDVITCISGLIMQVEADLASKEQAFRANLVPLYFECQPETEERKGVAPDAEPFSNTWMKTRFQISKTLGSSILTK